MADAPADSYSQEDRVTAERMATAHYEDLKRIARARRRRHSAGSMLRTTDLLHESFLRLQNMQSGWQDETHFMRCAALAMRHVLIDHARARMSSKRGGGIEPVEYDETSAAMPEYAETPEDLVVVADLLTRLSALDPRLEQIVDLRYFAGFTEEEAAEVLGVSARTVRRDWTKARAWIASEMGR